MCNNFWVRWNQLSVYLEKNNDYNKYRFTLTLIHQRKMHIEVCLRWFKIISNYWLYFTYKLLYLCILRLIINTAPIIIEE